MQLPWQPRSLEFVIWDASSSQCLSLRNRCSWAQLKLWCSSGGWRRRCRLSPSSTALLPPGRDHIHCTEVLPLLNLPPPDSGKRLCLAGAALQIPGVPLAALGSIPHVQTGKCGDRTWSRTSGHRLSTGYFPLGILHLVCVPQYLSLCQEIYAVVSLWMILMFFP